MHLIFATRGNKNDVERMISELQGKYFPYKNKGKVYPLSALVQPIQLWSVVVPKDSIQTLLHTIPDSNFHKEKTKWPLKMLRKAMGAKEIPPLDDKVLGFPIYNQNTEIVHIGIIEDKINADGDESI